MGAERSRKMVWHSAENRSCRSRTDGRCWERLGKEVSAATESGTTEKEFLEKIHAAMVEWLQPMFYTGSTWMLCFGTETEQSVVSSRDSE